MTMTSKICNNCGSEVDESSNFCPNCKSQSFRKKAEIIEADDSIVHKLFYWNFNNRYILAKSKVLGAFVAVTFIIGCFATPFPLVVAAIGLVIALAFYAGGYLIRRTILKPSDAQLGYNDFGLIKDIANTLFYWQDKRSGEFILSKTKIITVVIFILCAIWATTASISLAFMVVFASIFTIPAFAVGFVIHKLTYTPSTNPRMIKTAKKPKREIPKKEPEVIEDASRDVTDSELLRYKREIENLKEKYDAKDEAARKLIEKRFAPPQLTYTRFISSVDNAKDLFTSQAASALNIINLSSDFSPRIKSELDSKIDILNTIIAKLDDLTNELVVSMDESKEDDVHNLIDDMDDLINSVDTYK